MAWKKVDMAHDPRSGQFAYFRGHGGPMGRCHGAGGHYGVL